MMKALTLVAVLATASLAAGSNPPAFPSVERMHAQPTSLDAQSSKVIIGSDGEICHEYYAHLEHLERFEAKMAEREVDGKKTMSKEDAKSLKKIIKGMKKKTKLTDENGKKVDYMCDSKSSRAAFYQSILPEFDTVTDLPPITEEQKEFLARPTRDGAAVSRISSESSTVTLSNSNARFTPCSTYSNCPYADCYSCFFGWENEGGTPLSVPIAKAFFEIVAHEYTFNPAGYVPFPDVPVEFFDRECKVSFFKHYAFPEPSNAVSNAEGTPCREAKACNDFIVNYNYKNNEYNNYQNAEDCVCSTSQYSGKSVAHPWNMGSMYNATINEDTGLPANATLIPGVVVAFDSICVNNLQKWVGNAVLI